MSKEVRVVAWCDGPHEHREPGVVERREPWQGEVYLLDLCEPCNKAVEDLMEQMREWLRRGIPESKAQAAPSPPRQRKKRASRGADTESVFMRTCQEPDCDYGTAPTRSALGQHTKKHGKNLSDYDWSA